MGWSLIQALVWIAFSPLAIGSQRPLPAFLKDMESVPCELG